MRLYDQVFAELEIPDAWKQPFEHLEFDPHGWFGDDNKNGLTRIAIGKPIVIELGSWLGASTRHLATLCDVVIAIDHWEGSPEHQRPERTDVKDKLPKLYDQFLSNCYTYRSRIIPVRMSTEEAAKLSLPKADVIYVDAAHEQESVLKDLELYAPFLKEDGVMCGDDWLWGPASEAPVAKAVIRFAQANGLTINNQGNFWWYESHD